MSESAPIEGQMLPELRVVPMRWGKGALMLTVALAWVASVLGTLVVPSLRGNASEALVVPVEKTSAFFGYASVGLVVALLCAAAFELAKAKEVHLVGRIAAVLGAGLTLAITSPALSARVPPIASFALDIATSLSVLILSAVAASKKEGRVFALMGLCFALSSIMKLASFQLALDAAEKSRGASFAFARNMARFALLLEGLGQLAAISFWAKAGGQRGRIAAVAAGALALVLTVGAMLGAKDGNHALRTALVEVQWGHVLHGLPLMSAWIAALGFGLAASAFVLPRRLGAMPALFALLLVSRARYDIPAAALFAMVAVLWGLLASASAPPART